MRDVAQTVRRFNECINNRDLSGLSALMTIDHVFVDTEGGRQQGRDTMIKVWDGFFRNFPDYQNHFAVIQVNENNVVISGHSTCSFIPLSGPALWMAQVENQRIAEWHVYDDTDENRQLLGLPS